MVAIRDLVCAQAVGKMTEMGCFEEEFITYGCAYLQGDHIKYLVTAKSETMSQFLVECALHGMHPTPVKERLDRSLVPTDGREELKQKFKLDMVRELRHTYNDVFFEALTIIAQTPANDLAQPLLLQLQETLEGTYDETMLRLYEELARLALRRKVLTKESYLAIADWLKEVRQQMVDDTVTKEQYSRCFAGFAYEQATGERHYYVNAQPQVAEERQRKMIANGALVTPLLRKVYWFKSENQLMEKRQAFEMVLKKAIDDDYMQLFKMIHRLPTKMDAQMYRTQLANVKAHCTDGAVAAFESYGTLWASEELLQNK